MIELDADIRKKMAHLSAQMKEAADGKILKRELSKKLRGLMQPLVAEQKTRVLRLSSKGHPGPSMRQAIARQTKAATRWSGQNMGVQIIQRARSMPRDFQYAGRMFNRAEGWNPTTLGGEVEHQQVRPAQWFDSATKGQRPHVAQEVHAALEQTAATLAAKARAK